MNDFKFVWRCFVVVLCVGLGLVAAPALISARSNEAVLFGIALLICLPVAVRLLWQVPDRLFNKKEGS